MLLRMHIASRAEGFGGEKKEGRTIVTQTPEIENSGAEPPGEEAGATERHPAAYQASVESRDVFLTTPFSQHLLEAMIRI
jgi:hypothetical protein